MSPTALLDPETIVVDDDFVLDMRVIEMDKPIVEMMCSTSDGCGSSCSTSACASSSYDPS